MSITATTATEARELLAAHNIHPNSDWFADCPLCEEKKALNVYYDEGMPAVLIAFSCTNCGEEGDAENGWSDKKALEQGYVTVSNMRAKLEEAYASGMAPGARTGFETLDPLYRVRKGTWTLVTGIPGHGKSEVMDALVINLAVEQGWKFAMFSPENLPLQMHLSKLCEKLYGRPFGRDMRNQNTGEVTPRLTRDEMGKAAEFLDKHFFFLYPKKRSIEDILAVVDTLIRKKGIDGVLIDPWNELEHQCPPYMNETSYISKVLSKIRTYARAKNIHIWIVAHPAKLQRELTGERKGQYPVPRPYDVSGSAHFANKCDYALSVWRDVVKDADSVVNEVWVFVQKVRFKVDGRIGKVMFRYDRHRSILMEGDSMRWNAPILRINQAVQEDGNDD